MPPQAKAALLVTNFYLKKKTKEKKNKYIVIYIWWKRKAIYEHKNVHISCAINIYDFIFLGDVREAVNKIRKYVESESAFFNAFLEEGLRFSSSLHLCLIWIRVLKHVLQNPKEAADHLINHPFFKKFGAGHLQRPTLTDCANRYNPSLLVLLLDCQLPSAGSAKYSMKKQLMTKQEAKQGELHHHWRNPELCGTAIRKKMLSLTLHR